MRNYSYAGTSRGKSNPEDILTVTEDSEGEWPNDRFKPTGSHLSIAWSGGEYSYHNTWISADQDSVEKLKDME